MTTAAEKGRATRERNQEARIAVLREQQELLKTARQALKRVMDDPEATTEQLLRAAELLKELGKH